VRENVVVVTVPRTQTYTIYGVTGTGRVYPVKEVLKKGWKALGLRDGTVLLKWSCGNPLTTKLPVVPKPKPIARRLPPPQSSVAPLPQPTVIASAETLLPGYAPGVAQPVPGAPGILPIETVPAQAPAVLPLLPLVGLLGVHGHTEVKPSNVPECDSLVLFAVGMGALLGAFMWRRRREATPRFAGTRGR